MSDTKEFLKQMIAESGLSGYEAPIRAVIETEWQALTDELSVSRLGSLHALRRGSGPQPRQSVMVATHMDAIGLMVTGIKAGFLHITQIGGIDPRVLPGQLVTVHTSDEALPGIIVQPPAHTLPSEYQSGPVPLTHLLVDVGLQPKQVAEIVKVGDLVSFASEPTEMDGELIVGHSLDNRASVAVLTETLQLLQNRSHPWDVWAVASAQEEETLGGALTSGYALEPTIAVVIDVTFAKGPGTPTHESYEMDKGPTIGWGPNIHPKLYKLLKELADSLEIPVQKEISPRMSGTDAIATQIVRNGIPTVLIGIPLNYMHTPVEVISMKNVRRAGRLLAEFIAGLDADFMQKLSWEEA